MVSLIKKRVYDIAACSSEKVKVYLNDERINIRSFGDYMAMFYNDQFPSTPVYEEYKVDIIDAKTKKRLGSSINKSLPDRSFNLLI